MTDRQLPFQFAPVAADGGLHTTPVGHDQPFCDVTQDGEYLSGRIGCSLYGLTPLLVGNVRTKNEFGPSYVWPLMIEDQFLISMHSLRGMLRSMTASLCGNRMERVSEKRGFVRPQLDVCSERYVVAKDVEGRLCVQPVKSLGEDHPDRESAERAAGDGGGVSKVGVGSDGQGVLAAAHDLALEKQARLRNEVPKGYPDIAVKREKWAAFMVLDEKPIPLDDVLLEYRVTTELEQGMVESHVNNSNIEKVLTARKMTMKDLVRCIEEHRALEEGAFVYCEIFDGRLLSLGRSFRYKWACRDTTTTKGGKTRGELGYSPEEKASWFLESRGAWSERKTKGVNAVFGFAARKEWLDGEKGVLEEGYKGRVSLSHGAYVGPDDCVAQDDVVLKILAQPKPLNAGNALSQRHEQKEVNYGVEGYESGDLAGRKHYLHYPRAFFGNEAFASAKGEAVGSQHTCFKTLFRPAYGNHGVTRLPQFRLTVHFESLRPWELGLLLLSLDLGNGFFGLNADEVTQRVRLRWPGQGRPAVHAHKIGGGRPLGLGSCIVVGERLEFVKKTTLNGANPFPTVEVDRLEGEDARSSMSSLMKEGWKALGCDSGTWPTKGRLNALRLITQFSSPPKGVEFGYPATADDALDFAKKRKVHEAKARHGKYNSEVRASALSDIGDRPELPVVSPPPPTK